MTNWQVGVWYTHPQYPQRRVLVTDVSGDMAAGYVHSKDSFWPIILSAIDWELITSRKG